MMVSTGPSEYMCRREGGKDTDKGQRQEKENSIQANKESHRSSLQNKEEKSLLVALCLSRIFQRTDRRYFGSQYIYLLKGGQINHHPNSKSTEGTLPKILVLSRARGERRRKQMAPTAVFGSQKSLLN